MRDLLILFLGCIFGTCIALVVLGLCFAARAEKPKQAGYQPKRPTEPPKPPTTGSNAQKPNTGGFLLGTDLFCVAEANKKLGYKRGVEDFAEKLKNALPRDCIVLSAVIDQAAKEQIEKEDAEQ